MDALEWVKNKGANAGQFLVSLGGKTVQEFLDKIALFLNKSWRSGNNNTQLLELDNGVVITYYIDSSGQPALLIRLGGLDFKIRLQ